MLDERSAIYSCRPHSIMLSDLMGWGWVMSILPYGPRWKAQRKLFQQHFHPSKTATHQPYEQEQVHKLLERLLETPQDFLVHVRHIVGGLALGITYGRSVKSHNDPHLRVTEAAINAASYAGTPGAFLVDIFPPLRYLPEWLPGAGFKRKARAWKSLMEEMRDRPFHDLEAKLAAGVSPRPSFVSAALGGMDLSQGVSLQRQVVRDTAGMVFAAAADTTTASIEYFFLAMILYPQVQRRAQQELDRVLQGRLPDVKDQPDLPYITAIAKEVLRWRPATPIGVPHMSTGDDVFRGYFIPKGTIIVANAWSMLHNEDMYPNPELFIPERYVKDGAIDPLVLDPATIAFGFGRRTCAGSHIAESLLWLTIASVLSMFEISKPLDENGRPVDVTAEYGSGIIAHSPPFACTVVPRCTDAKETIKALQLV
ncbi:cytochrome P450 [Coprinopsis marcescibilis]|uniref:Cytochrome P450 n=1 Tax=Coprinopsis marcescibilis TaxID=230819 RepID=A0A5C3LIS4_COPMA|nr:cytochrome P450 [Coprinopsis marcescibilis]